MPIPHGHSAESELADCVVLVVLHPGIDKIVLGSGAAPQFGFSPRLVPTAREIPHLHQLGRRVPVPDAVGQKGVDQRGRTRINRLAQGQQLIRRALAGIRPTPEQQFSDITVERLDSHSERGGPLVIVPSSSRSCFTRNVSDTADLWTWLIIAAHTRLSLARPLTEDLRRPWERRTESRRLTPARVRRGFRNIHATAARPAAAPKPSRPGPGRPSGSKNKHRAGHHDVGKTVKRAESIKEHQARRG